MRKRALIVLLLVGAMVTAFAVVAPVIGSPGGVGNRNLQANGCSVHNIAGSDTVTMTASKLNPSPGEQITVTVTVSGGQGSGTKMGVSLLTALSSSSGTMPSDKGWSIVSDPSGTKYNYNEGSYSGSATFTWTLTAPSTAGSYKLYARAYMGPSFYYKDASQGLSFTVGTTVVTPPTVKIATPAASGTVQGAFSVIATVTAGSVSTISSAILRIDATTVGTLTTAPYSWIVDSTAYANGVHTINVTATDSGNHKGYAQQTVIVSNYQSSAGTAPTVSITGPANGTTVSGRFNVSATVTSTVSIANATLNLDGVKVSTLSAGPYLWTVDSSALAVGKHVLQVYAFDVKGVVGTAQSQTVVRSGPVFIGMVLPSSASGTVDLTPVINTTDTISLLSYHLDGVLVSNMTAPPYTLSLDTTSFSDGSHTLNVTAVTISGARWSQEFTLVTLNDQGSSFFVLTSIDLLIMMGLVLVSVVAIVFTIVGRKKGPGRETPR
jgi:hypothetical protein